MPPPASSGCFSKSIYPHPFWSHPCVGKGSGAAMAWSSVCSGLMYSGWFAHPFMTNRAAEVVKNRYKADFDKVFICFFRYSCMKMRAGV